MKKVSTATCNSRRLVQHTAKRQFILCYNVHQGLQNQTVLRTEHQLNQTKSKCSS